MGSISNREADSSFTRFIMLVPAMTLVRTILFVTTLLLMCNPLVAQYTNIRVSSPSSTTPEEVTIAINPTNPLNLVAGANLRFYYYSIDGGASWSQGQLPLGTWGDPCVIFDAAGRAYYGHLSSPAGGFFIERLIVHRSSDGGKTWSDSVGVGYNPPKQQDKEWLAYDMTNSQYRNNIYMAWTEFDKYGSKNPQDSSRILFSRSTNGGQTWSSPVKISDQSGNCVDSDSTVEGAVPAVGPNGEVYLAWAGPRGIMFDKSTDGGLTFGTDIFVTSHPGGWDFNVAGISRCNGLPVTACDVSNSPYRGRIYVMWSDQRNGTINTDVFLIKSTDGGKTWGSEKRINDDATTTQQFFPWMAIDQSTGYLYFVFYDRRNTIGNATDVYVARSTDGGETFTNFKVSQVSFTPTQSIFFGDYINIAAHNRSIHPIWMRMDGTDLSVWTTVVRDSVAVSVAEDRPGAFNFRLGQNYPNPFNASTMIRFTLPVHAPTTLRVFDVLGREVAMLLDGEFDAGEHSVMMYGDNLASGIYCYRLQSGPYVETRRLILVK
ncbi:MAG: exo-alpha-sialidase [Bacteroidota bacterium]